MMKVVVGGSRKIAKLNKDIRGRVDDILKKGHVVLIGDANGADKAMQQYFSEKHYPSVIVYCTGTTCRNNLGKWPVVNVQSARTSKDFAYYAVKDQQMCQEANYGFLLWDGKSKGTLNNILSLLENSKQAFVYFSPKRLLIKLLSARDLTHLLKNCDQESLAYFDKTLQISERLNLGQRQLSLV